MTHHSLYCINLPSRAERYSTVFLYNEYKSDREDSENLKYGTLENFTIIPKQMTLEQLKGGAYWLVWNLYKPENLTERIKRLFEDFDNSPKKDELSFQRLYLRRRGFQILTRVIKFFLIEATPLERKTLLRLIHLAMKFSFPGRFGLYIGLFLEGKKVQDTLFMQIPYIDQISYPK